MHDGDRVAQAERLLSVEHEIDPEELCDFLHHTGADAAENVIKKKLLSTPNLFDDSAEHPKHEHVQDDVLPTAVHKHVSDELINMKVARQEEMKTTKVVEICHACLR